jgi:hypothetical protein
MHWPHMSETPLEWIRPGKVERTNLLIKRIIHIVKKSIRVFTGIFGIFAIIFIIVQIDIGPRPMIEKDMRSDLQIELDGYMALK